MKRRTPRRQRGRPVAWSFGARPTSSPASSTPRCAASGLDLGPAPKARHPCRRRLALSLAWKRQRVAAWLRCHRHRTKQARVRGFAPETPPRGSAPWNPAKGSALGTLHLVGRRDGGKAANFLGSRLPSMRHVRRLRRTGSQRQNRSVSYFRVSGGGFTPGRGVPPTPCSPWSSVLPPCEIKTSASGTGGWCSPCFNARRRVGLAWTARRQLP